MPIPKFQTPPILAGRFEAVRGNGSFLRKWRRSERKRVSAHLILLVTDLSKANTICYSES